MSRVIGVFSGKGGVGKTTLVANLGASLSNDFHKNVLVLDTNIHSSHLGLHLSLYEDPPVTLKDVLKRQSLAMHATYIHPSTGMRVLPAPLSGQTIDLTNSKMHSLVKHMDKSYDIIVMDCAPGLGKEVIIPMKHIDDAIVISTADIVSITDAMKTIELLKKFKKNILGLVINRYKHAKYELTPQEITSTSNYNIIAVIPEDSKIPDSVVKGLPVVASYPNSKSSIEFKKLAGTLVNEKYNKPNFLGRMKTLFTLRKAPSKEHAPVMQANKQMTQKDVSDISKVNEKLIEEITEESRREIMERVKAKLEEKLRER